MSSTNSTKSTKQPKQQQKKSRAKKAELPIKSAVPSALQQLVHAIALYLAAPGEENVKAFRWSSEFSQAETALADPFRIVQPDFGNTDAGGDLWNYTNENQGVMFLFRGVECAAIILLQNAAKALKEYAVHFRQNGSVQSNAVLSLPLFGATDLLTPYAKNLSTSYAPHGQYLYAGAVAGSPQRFLWLDTCDELIVTHKLASGGPTAAVIYQLSRYDATGLSRAISNIGATVSSAASSDVTLKAVGDPAGYYCVSVLNGEATVTNLNIEAMKIAGDGSCMAHLALPNFESNWLRESGVRINALSALFTNTSPVMELGGTVAGCQFGSKTDWMDLLKLDVLTAVQTVKGSHSSDIRRGLHGFLKPTQPEDFRIQAYSEIDDSGNFVDSFYPLDNRGAFLCIAMSIPSPGQGNDGYITLRYGIEYLSQDTWASTGPSDVPDEAFKMALGYLRTLDQFHENPVHLKEIWNKIKNGAKKAVSFLVNTGPKIINGVKQVSEILGAL